MKNRIVILYILITVFALTNKTNAATFNVIVPLGTNECWLTGNFKLIQGTNDWDPSYYRMIKVDNTHFSIDISDVEITLSGQTLSTIRYKYLSGPTDWAYVEKDAAGNEIAVRVYVNGNDVVAKWGLVYMSSVNIRVYTLKIVSECYITGSFNNWSKPGTIGTKMNLSSELSDSLGNLFFTTISTPDPSTLVYKFAAGSMWNYLQSNSNLIPNFSNCVSYHDTITFNRIYNLATLKIITLNVKAPAGTSMVYLMGNNVSWDGINWLAGVKNSDGSFTFTVNNVDLLEYNYFNVNNWANIESDSDGNSRVARNADAQLNTTFNDTIVGWKIP